MVYTGTRERALPGADIARPLTLPSDWWCNGGNAQMAELYHEERWELDSSCVCGRCGKEIDGNYNGSFPFCAECINQGGGQ